MRAVAELRVLPEAEQLQGLSGGAQSAGVAFVVAWLPLVSACVHLCEHERVQGHPVERSLAAAAEKLRATDTRGWVANLYLAGIGSLQARTFSDRDEHCHSGSAGAVMDLQRPIAGCKVKKAETC